MSFYSCTVILLFFLSPTWVPLLLTEFRYSENYACLKKKDCFHRIPCVPLYKQLLRIYFWQTLSVLRTSQTGCRSISLEDPLRTSILPTTARRNTKCRLHKASCSLKAGRPSRSPCSFVPYFRCFCSIHPRCLSYSDSTLAIVSCFASALLQWLGLNECPALSVTNAA